MKKYKWSTGYIEEISASSLFVLALVTTLMFLASGSDAFAGLSSAVSKVYSEANSVVTGLAALAVFALGVGAVFGRISVPQALVVATGIVIASSSGQLAGMVTGDMASSVDRVSAVAGRISGPLCIISLIALGIATMYGKMTWTQALAVAIGIAILGDFTGIAAEIRR